MQVGDNLQLKRYAFDSQEGEGKTMKALLRWVGIKLLCRHCMHKSYDWTEQRKTYDIVHRGAIHVRLVGQQPGAMFGSPGRKCFVLIGECVHHLVGRAVLRKPGAFFESTGIIRVKSGPGRSWCWFLQFGR